MGHTGSILAAGGLAVWRPGSSDSADHPPLEKRRLAGYGGPEVGEQPDAVWPDHRGSEWNE